MPRRKGKKDGFNKLLILLVIPWSLKKLGDGIFYFLKSLTKIPRPKFKLPKIFYPTPLKVGVAFTLIVFLFFIYSLFLINLAHSLPSPDMLSSDNGPETTEIYDRNGKLLYRLYEDVNRTPVKLSSLPTNLVNATVATEDKNYWAHPGVDFEGIARALLSDVQGNRLQGGSTITQQLIKNTLLNADQTWQRKLKEVFLSFWAERIYNKQQILEMYFNQIPYGGSSVGIEAAAQTYFGENAKNLDLAQSAYLAGLPVSPTSYSPYGPNPDLGKERQGEVLERMVENHYISQEQAKSALSEKLDFKPPTEDIKAPHFVMYVKNLLSQRYGEKTISQGGLKIYTTLDLNLQETAQRIVKEQVDKLSSLNVSNGAAMIVDPRNGQILAMVGSKDYYDPQDGEFNVALALRQPGSSIKVVTYSTAFKMGLLTPGSTILDAPIAFTTPWETYAPVNYDGTFHGLVTVRTALGSSYNIPAVKTLNMEGIPNFLQSAKDMGITTFNQPQDYGLSLTLGGADVTMVDMMSVYSTISQMGVKHQINPILKIVDSKGQVIEDDENPEGTQVLPPGVAYMVTNILADNGARTPAFGPNSLLLIPGHSVAVKTGTTDDKRDNWTFGYTPDVAIGVWVGNNDNTPMNPALTSGVTGAAPIWNALMNNVLKNQPDIAFQMPDDLIYGNVNGHQDLVLKDFQNLAGIPNASNLNTPTPGILSLTQSLPIPSNQPNH